MDVGIVTSIQFNHKEVNLARKGEEVCVKIDPIPGESPKMVGRHFEETDEMVSKVRFIFISFHFDENINPRAKRVDSNSSPNCP